MAIDGDVIETVRPSKGTPISHQMSFSLSLWLWEFLCSWVHWSFILWSLMVVRTRRKRTTDQRTAPSVVSCGFLVSGPSLPTVPSLRSLHSHPLASSSCHVERLTMERCDGVRMTSDRAKGKERTKTSEWPVLHPPTWPCGPLLVLSLPSSLHGPVHGRWCGRSSSPSPLLDVKRLNMPELRICAFHINSNAWRDAYTSGKEALFQMI